jgi:hypothetical protein
VVDSGEDDEEGGLAWYRAVVHECDRLGKESDEASVPLPVEVYQMFGDALVALGSVEADANSSLYSETPRLRPEHKQFFDAAIERYELGLGEFHNDVNLALSLTLALLRRQAIVHDWYSKKDSYDAEKELSSAIEAFYRVLGVIESNLERAKHLMSIGAGLSESAVFIEENEWRNFFFEASVGIYRQTRTECLLKDEDESASLAIQSLTGAGRTYLNWALKNFEEDGDGTVLKKKLLKGLELTK